MNKFTLICGCFLLTACSDNGEDAFALPEFAASWNAQQDADERVKINDITQTQAWWQQFDDASLHKIVELALKQNHDLRIAHARLLEARANRTDSASLLFPRIDGTARASRGVQGIIGGNKPFNLYDAAFDASWEIDLFGANHARTDAADSTIAAWEANEDYVRLSLTAEVVRSYIDMRTAQAQMVITRRAIKSQQGSLDLSTSRRDAGLVSDLDVSQADSLLLSTRAQLPLYKAQYDAAMNRLHTLSGSAPGIHTEWLQVAGPIPVPPAQMVIQTPASVIERRPDIELAQQQLLARTYLSKAATRDLFPKLSLSGLFGFQNTSVLPSTTIWSAGSGALLPLLNFGQLRARIDAADARQAAALAEYERSVLTALEEVETSLSQFLQETTRSETLQLAARSSGETVSFADERYTRGITSFNDVLDAQARLYNAQSAEVNSRADSARYAVALYKALGSLTLPAESSAASQATSETIDTPDTTPDLLHRAVEAASDNAPQ